jgi:hypothetical protein
MDKVALRKVFSEYSGFPCQFSFHQMLHTHLLSGAGTIGQLVADVPSGLSITPPHEIKKITPSLPDDLSLLLDTCFIHRVLIELVFGAVCFTVPKVRKPFGDVKNSKFSNKSNSQS